MDILVHSWDQIEADQPVPLLSRKRIKAERIMVARVELAKGCVVAMHSHEMEQVAMIMSGRVIFKLGQPGSSDYREVDVTCGDVVELPSHFPHGVEVIESAVILDILSPPGEMGVDRQK